MKRVLTFLFFAFFGTFLTAQNVGINTITPTENLHIRTDSSKVAIRLDHKKSVNGYNHGSVIGIPSTLAFFPDTLYFFGIPVYDQDWSSTDINKITSSDDDYISSPDLNDPDLFGLESPKLFKLDFQMSSDIPEDAIISEVKLEFEYHTTTCPYDDSSSENTNSSWAAAFDPGFDCEILPLIMSMYNADSSGLVQFSLLPSPTTVDDTIIAMGNIGGMITASDFNNQTIPLYVDSYIEYLSSFTLGLSIDRIRIKVDYLIPAEGTENVFWSLGAKEGNLSISNSPDLTNPALYIDESGVTRLKALQISDDAAVGKTLLSDDQGRAYWGNLPKEPSYWKIVDDYLTSVNLPVQITKKLEAHEGINLGGSTEQKAGDIRWNPIKKNFEGFTGGKWLSFTTNEGWGTTGGNEAQSFNSSPSEKYLGGSVDIDGTSCIANSDSSFHIYENDLTNWNEVINFELPFSILDVAIDGDYAIATSLDTAVIYFKDNGTWTFQEGYNLPTIFDGWVVDLSGDTAVFGSGNNEIIIIRRDGTSWSLEHSIPVDPLYLTGFGSSVSLLDNYLVIGAPGTSFSVEGYVSVYHRTGTIWTGVESIQASDGYNGNNFGRSISFVNDWMLVGAKNSAYLFKIESEEWVEKEKFETSNSITASGFGWDVSLSSTAKYALIGNSFASDHPGEAYIYERTGSNWAINAILNPSDGEDSDGFGTSVSLTNNAVVIGAPNKNIDNGKVYFFNNN